MCVSVSFLWLYEELQNRSRSRHSEWLIYAGGGGLGKVEDEKSQATGLKVRDVLVFHFACALGKKRVCM